MQCDAAPLSCLEISFSGRQTFFPPSAPSPSLQLFRFAFTPTSRRAKRAVVNFRANLCSLSGRSLWLKKTRNLEVPPSFSSPHDTCVCVCVCVRVCVCVHIWLSFASVCVCVCVCVRKRQEVARCSMVCCECKTISSPLHPGVLQASPGFLRHIHTHIALCHGLYILSWRVFFSSDKTQTFILIVCLFARWLFRPMSETAERSTPPSIPLGQLNPQIYRRQIQPESNLVAVFCFSDAWTSLSKQAWRLHSAASCSHARLDIVRPSVEEVGSWWWTHSSDGHVHAWNAERVEFLIKTPFVLFKLFYRGAVTSWCPSVWVFLQPSERLERPANGGEIK